MPERIHAARTVTGVTVWSVYLVRCRDGTLYTGIATDVERRLAEHQSDSGKGARYLRGRGPLELVLHKKLGDRGLALRVEGHIKRLSKRRKERLIEDDRWLAEMVTEATSNG